MGGASEQQGGISPPENTPHSRPTQYEKGFETVGESLILLGFRSLAEMKSIIAVQNKIKSCFNNETE
ncbi:hypothetical protein OUZ56_019880 [Daphnia magna]|uniref:Uncharacterized protein n=1 Tax=Daphnia magna TaxID=35525 RepID=A0ABQ9ZCW6_9CRUS|nr:hypothetical protein OUZ56_019880 [Daphnia magna]